MPTSKPNLSAEDAALVHEVEQASAIANFADVLAFERSGQGDPAIAAYLNAMEAKALGVLSSQWRQARVAFDIVGPAVVATWLKVIVQSILASTLDMNNFTEYTTNMEIVDDLYVIVLCGLQTIGTLDLVLNNPARVAESIRRQALVWFSGQKRPSRATADGEA